ncbi:hypothetical protein [Moorena producens]|uniref:hypothetical protein n=1 Tax=Moorena producens TaxID=1155739 RepID=UPI003C7617E1
MHDQMRSLPFSDGEMGRNRRVGSGCCLKLASSREALDQPLPTRVLVESAAEA